MVARDDSGNFVVSRTLVYPGLSKVDEVEIMGVFKTISRARDLGFVDIEVDMDAKNVQEAILGELIRLTQFLGVSVLHGD
ncbi:hypothetical protein ACS0TY_021177 [Phlomoides rotata]